MKYSWLAGFSIIVATLLLSCSESDSSKNKKGEKVVNGVVKTYHGNGKLRAQVPMKNGKREGLAVEYYASGKKHMEISYVKGKNHGVSKRYYENGNVYEETSYQMGVIEGPKKKYRQDGKVSTEAKYHNGQPCAGLKEYLTNGKLKTNYPTIVVEPVDRILLEGKYFLRFSMSDKSRNVTFYRGKLTDNCMTEELLFQEIPEMKDGVAQFYYELPEGSFVMEEFPVVAKVKTALGNYYITTRLYNVAVENR